MGKFEEFPRLVQRDVHPVEKGREEGLKEGIEKGLKEGLEQGRKEECFKNAKK